VIEGDIFSSKTDELFECGFGVPEATLGLAGEKKEGLVGDFNFLRIGDFAEVGADKRIGNPAKVEPLAAGEDGGGEFLNLGGGEDKFYVSGGFFEGFQEGVEGFGCEHVDFVDDVDFEFSASWGVGDAVPQVFDFANATIRGAIDFEDIEAAAVFDFFADIVGRVEIGLGSVRTVEGFREDSGGGGFSDASWTDKEESVGEASFRDGVRESADNMFLSHQFLEGPGAVFAGEDEITHDL
jgi:hypothetical protein